VVQWAVAVREGGVRDLNFFFEYIGTLDVMMKKKKKKLTHTHTRDI
jgi:hypothetical protein